MRLLSSAVLLITGLSIGCSAQGGPTTPVGQSEPSPAASLIHELDGVTYFPAGRFHLDIDRVTLTGQVTPIRQANALGDLFWLPVRHLGMEFILDDVTVPGVDTLRLNYRIRHPFPAPSNPGGPASAANRADLGVAGMVYFRSEPEPLITSPDPADVDYEGNYGFNFGAGYVFELDTRLIPDEALGVPNDGNSTFRTNHADYAPPGYKNLYPTQPIVDDSQPDSRTNSFDGTAIPRGADSTGNYLSTQMWSSTSQVTPNKIGYTGYGVLHQGQESSGSFDIAIDDLPNLDMEILVLATYADPRGGSNGSERRANRLPSNDPTKFAYKMPHGAFDLEYITTQNLTVMAGGVATFDLVIVDQDAAATVDATPTAPLTAIPHASGAPRVRLSSSELGLQTSDIVLPTPTGTGTWEDPLIYPGIIINDLATATGGIDAGAWVGVHVFDEQGHNAAPNTSFGLVLDIYLTAPTDQSRRTDDLSGVTFMFVPIT